MTNTDDFLAHYGVLGMKWGVRKDRRKGVGKPRRAKPRPASSMTDVELRQRINRLNMEQQYANLTKRQKGVVEKFLIDYAKAELKSVIESGRLRAGTRWVAGQIETELIKAKKALKK